ncbi:hypothetical protein AMK68_02335, partial [candidate division KD3-62 bacterium DG_56]
TQSPDAGTIVGTGGHTVTITVTDASGNSATCTATVTVLDDTAPTITQCATDRTLWADASCQAAIPDITAEVTASDNCDPTPAITQSPTAGTIVGTGDHTVTITVTDASGNSATCAATVTVVDDTAPTITQCATDKTLSADASCEAAIPDLTGEVTASDNCDPAPAITQSPAAGTIVGAGDHTVTITVTDASGNSATCAATVTVPDDTAPVITECAADRTLLADADCQVTLPDLTGQVVASDPCGPVSVSQEPAPGTILGEGQHVIVFGVSDDAGNISTCTSLVTVTCEGTRISLDLPGRCWYMLTIPCEPVDPQPPAVFHDDLGNPIPISGNLHRFDGSGYVTYLDFNPSPFGMITPGDAYWLYVFEDTTICYAATCPSGPGEVYMPTARWYLVGSPLRGNMLFENLWLYHDGMGPEPFADAINIWIQDPLFTYDCALGGYMSAGVNETDDDHVMREFFGYWLYTFVDEVTLVIPQP